MAGIGRSAAGLRFFGDDLLPEHITSLLGGPPTDSYAKGDLWVTGGVRRTRRTGTWRRNAQDRILGNLDDQIIELFDGLTTELQVWRDLSERFRGDLFCGVFMSEPNEGLVLQPSLMGLISERGLVLGFDIYDSANT